MANIKITPESLRSQAQSLRRYNDDHRNTFSQMSTHVHGLRWTGAAQRAFIEAFDGNKASFEKFAVDIDAFAKLMDDAANRMEQADQERSAKMAI